jgi:hypothetical protein
MSKAETNGAFACQNLALILGTIIALPVGRASSRNDGRYIFAEMMNLTEWPTGWTFMLAVRQNLH